MKKIILLLLFITGIHPLKAQSGMTTYEYWFDEDYGNAQSGLLSGNIFSSAVTTNGLNPGMHTLHYRASDSNGIWSAVVSQRFYKPVKLTTYEYWFDEAYATRSTISTTNTPDILMNTSVNAASLDYGMHHFHFRAQDEIGKWSAVVSQPCYVNSKIDTYEYWFDDDYANKTTDSLSTPLSSLEVNELINTLSLSGTHHQIHVRTHKQDGSWSTTLTQPFQKRNRIVAYEYWFNDQFAAKVYQSVVPTNQFELSPVIDASTTPLGSNTVYIHFKDENNRWSSVISDGFCHNTGDSSIHLKLFLEGYYAGNSSMTAVLMNQGIGSNALVTDSIDVELRDENPPYGIIASTRAELRTDGSAKCDFPFSFIGSYYLAVKHRNTIETWSAYPLFRGNCPLLYDFSLSPAQAYGNNMKEVENGVWAFYTGDINQDENIDLLDLSILENDINLFQYGYYATDLNGDGNTDLLDSPLVEANINEFVFAVHP